MCACPILCASLYRHPLSGQSSHVNHNDVVKTSHVCSSFVLCIFVRPVYPMFIPDMSRIFWLSADFQTGVTFIFVPPIVSLRNFRMLKPRLARGQSQGREFRRFFDSRFPGTRETAGSQITRPIRTTAARWWETAMRTPRLRRSSERSVTSRIPRRWRDWPFPRLRQTRSAWFSSASRGRCPRFWRCPSVFENAICRLPSWCSRPVSSGIEREGYWHGSHGR